MTIDQNPDRTGVVGGGLPGYAAISWIVWARKWFTGPKVHGTPAELEAIEDRYEKVAREERALGRA